VPKLHLNYIIRRIEFIRIIVIFPLCYTCSVFVRIMFNVRNCWSVNVHVPRLLIGPSLTGHVFVTFCEQMLLGCDADEAGSGVRRYPGALLSTGQQPSSSWWR